VERGRKMYCKQHDPAQVEMRLAESIRKEKEKWDGERKIREEYARLHKAFPLLVETLKTVRQKFDDWTLDYLDMEMVDKALEAVGSNRD